MASASLMDKLLSLQKRPRVLQRNSVRGSFMVLEDTTVLIGCRDG